MMSSYIRFADTLSTSMGKAFSWCIVILMGGTVYEVVMAYAFNKPTLWNFDFSMQMYGAILMMSGAYCLATEAHVRGDVIYRLFNQRTQAGIDLVLYFIFFLICFQGFIGWYMVSSGLVDRVDVSHFRLSVHLLIAFIILSMIFWNYSIAVAIAVTITITFMIAIAIA